MMDFKEDLTHHIPSNSSPNHIQFHQKADAEKIMKLHKYGFFHGNTSRNFTLSLTLPQRASNLFFKKTIKSLTKSKRVLFIKDMTIGGFTSNFPPQDEVKLGHLLRRTKKLRKFSFDKKWSEAITPRFVRGLSKCFSKLYFVKEIKLNLLGSFEIKTEECKKLGIALSRSLRLEKADITLTGCNGIGINGIHYMLYRFSKLQNLKSLQLDLSNCTCLKTELGFLMFNNSIGRLPNIESFNLKLSSNTLVSDDCLADIALGLQRLKKLKTLNMELGGTNVGNSGLAKIGEGLSALKNLEEVEIELWGCSQVGDEGVVKLSQGHRGLRKLKKLNVNFANCNQITTEGVYGIGDSLQGLNKLESLNVGLFGCTMLDKVAINSLSQKLKSLPKLGDRLNIST